jgi:hypothetical protein
LRNSLIFKMNLGNVIIVVNGFVAINGFVSIVVLRS